MDHLEEMFEVADLSKAYLKRNWIGPAIKPIIRFS